MITNNIFSLRRFGLLLKCDILLNIKSIAIFAAAVFAILALANVFAPNIFMFNNFHQTLFIQLLYLGGLFITVNAFADFRDQRRKQHFLTLPASNCEKFLSRLFLTTFGYPLGLVLMFFLASLMFSIKGPIFHLNHAVLLSMRDYYIIQSIFLLGAIYFKRMVIGKTILSLCALVVIVAIFNSPQIKILALLIIPCCWLIAYLRLTESEI